MNLTDTHCHLNDRKFSADLDKVVKRAEDVGVTRFINFGDTLENSAQVVDLAQKYRSMYAGVGIHPSEIKDFDKNNSVDKIVELAQKYRVVAIGEIGLDYHWEKTVSGKVAQEKTFIQQLDIARQLDLPVCVHERDAHGDAMRIMRKEAKGLRGVFHCFSGSLEMARELWKMGWLTGVDGPLTFKNSAKLPEVFKAAPREMILLETDSPYLAPMPNRGKRNEPAYLIEIAKALADLRGETLEEVAEYTTANAERLYKIGGI